MGLGRSRAGSTAPLRLRVRPGRRVPDAAPATLAIAFIAVWILLTPFPRLAGVPGQAMWLAIVGGFAVGAALGERSGRTPTPVVLAIVVAVVVVAAGLALVALPRLHIRLGASLTTAVGVASGFVVAGVVLGRARNVGTRPRELLVLAAVAAFIVGDWVVLGGQGMRDLRLYLVAGRHFLDGAPVYATTLMTAIPIDRADLPFLYPPMTLPLFGALAALPEALVILAWLAASLAAAVLALRVFGVRWPWVPVLLLWPPFFEGLWVGNVAILALALFAIGPRLGAALPASAVFKLQAAVPSLWLVRERRWSSLAIGVGALVALGALTLPLVGLESWRAWIDALRLFQGFEEAVPALFGAALPRFLPYAGFLAIAVVAVVVAMILGRGNRGLARLGIASVVASPSLYRHGFLVVLPGLLGNGETLFWLGLGLGFTPTSIGWWLTTSIGWWVTAAIAVIGTVRWRSAGARPAGTLHPLGPRGEPWSREGSSSVRRTG